MPADAKLIIEAPFNPLPLRRVLGRMGLATYGEHLVEMHWRIWCVREGARHGSDDGLATGDCGAAIWTEADGVHIDVRGLAAPVARARGHRRCRQHARDRHQDRARKAPLHRVNSLHWVIDMTFRADECRLRREHAPANFTTIRHMAHNLIRKASGKDSFRLRRMVAAWDENFLASLLTA